MMTHVHSKGAVAFGVACIIATIVILFGHVRSINDLTITHLYISMALVVTYGTGHFMWDAFAEPGWASKIKGASFTLLFLVATVICVSLSGGRSADIMDQRERDNKKIEDHRARLQFDIAQAEGRLNQARLAAKQARGEATDQLRSLAQTCKDGKGVKCTGADASLAQFNRMAALMESQVKDLIPEVDKLRDQLNELPPPVEANGEVRHIARVYAMFAGVSEEVAFQRVKLLMPYLLALVTEFGSIVFLKHGFGLAQSTPTPSSPTQPTPTTLADIAAELKVDARLARKALREAGEKRNELGWVWNDAEADRIRSTLRRQISSRMTIAPPP